MSVTTDWHRAATLEASYPTTFLALQRLFMAMADLEALKRNPPAFFAKRKKRAAYDRFVADLTTCLAAMALDGVTAPNDSAAERRDKLVVVLADFSDAFPNWPDAVEFATDFFVVNSRLADAMIGDLMT